MATAYAVAGTRLQVNTGTSFENVPLVQTLSLTGTSKTEIDVTAISDNARKTVDGIPDYGEVTFEIAKDATDTVQNFLRGKFENSNQTVSMKIIEPMNGTGNTWTFTARMTEFTPSWQKDSFISASCKAKLDGGWAVT